jgi:hypothetical protein
LDPNSKYDSEYGNKIINAEPSVTIATTNIQPDESEELEEGECFFNEKMWVKGTLLHFITGNRS